MIIYKLVYLSSYINTASSHARLSAFWIEPSRGIEEALNRLEYSKFYTPFSPQQARILRHLVVQMLL